MEMKILTRIPVWLLVTMSAIALLINWGVVGYLATQNNPGAVHLWLPFAKYPKWAFGVLAFIGTLSGALAARGSKGWLVFSVLNVLTYLVEYVSS